MVLEGLDEFREHLGGELTVLMLQDIGQGIDIHQMDTALIGSCIDELRGISQKHMA
jgi:3-dehydroquinate synthase